MRVWILIHDLLMNHCDRQPGNPTVFSWPGPFCIFLLCMLSPNNHSPSSFFTHSPQIRDPGPLFLHSNSSQQVRSWGGVWVSEETYPSLGPHGMGVVDSGTGFPRIRWRILRVMRFFREVMCPFATALCYIRKTSSEVS